MKAGTESAPVCRSDDKKMFRVSKTLNSKTLNKSDVGLFFLSDKKTIHALKGSTLLFNNNAAHHDAARSFCTFIFFFFIAARRSRRFDDDEAF